MPAAEHARRAALAVRRKAPGAAPTFGTGRAVEHCARRRVQHVLMTADAVGGVWRYAVDLATALVERGVRTTLAVMGPPPDAGERRDAGARGILLLDRPYRLEWMDDPWDDVARAGRWLLSLERTLRPDIVHINGYAHAALPWSTPVVLVAHSCVRTWWRAVKGEGAPARLDAYRQAVAAGLEAAGVVIAPTRAMLEALHAEYAVGMATRVIPNGSSRPAAGRPQDGHTREEIVLAAGRVWDEAKNIAALCAVAGNLSWPVCVAGETRAPDGRRRKTPGVRRLGQLPPARMADWYERASIYALPARYEPFGLSVLEAARAGCTLVLGDIGSLRENWEGAAAFVPPGDHPALSSTLQQLIGDPQRRTELARRASERAAGFGIDAAADAYVRVYEDLVS